MHTITLTQTGQHQLTICGKKERKKERETECEKQRASQSPSTKNPMLKKLVSSRCLHIDANTCQGHCRKMHTTLMTKHGELNWLATPSMFQLLAPGSLIDTLNAAKGQSSKDLNRLGRQVHVEASDKQHQPVLLALVYVSFAGAWWAKRKDFVSQCGCLCAGTEKPLMKGSAAPCCPMSWLHAHMVPLRQAATQAQEGTEFIRLLWLTMVEGGYDDTMTDEKNSQIGRCLIKDGKGVFDAVIETNPQHCPCKTKDRRWKVLR